MKTDAVTAADLPRSVLAVPPLARHPDLTLDAAENRRLLRYLEAGGVTSIIYGGNANLYNIGPREFAQLLDMLAEIAGPASWIVPSIGADYGKALDQVEMLRARRFPTAMLLPQSGAATPDGVATGIRRLADRLGRPLVAYVKAEGYLEPEHLAALARDGAIVAVKYAIVREDPAKDRYLSRLVDQVDRAMIISGIGERPVVAHMRDFGVAGFTSGSVCVAPRLSTAILRALKARDYDRAMALRTKFVPLEDLRDRHSPIRVLHDAVALAGIAETGSMYPFLANIAAPDVRREIEAAAAALRRADEALGHADAA